MNSKTYLAIGIVLGIAIYFIYPTLFNESARHDESVPASSTDEHYKPSETLSPSPSASRESDKAKEQAVPTPQKDYSECEETLISFGRKRKGLSQLDLRSQIVKENLDKDSDLVLKAALKYGGYDFASSIRRGLNDLQSASYKRNLAFFEKPDAELKEIIVDLKAYVTPIGQITNENSDVIELPLYLHYKPEKLMELFALPEEQRNRLFANFPFALEDLALAIKNKSLPNEKIIELMAGFENLNAPLHQLVTRAVGESLLDVIVRFGNRELFNAYFAYGGKVDSGVWRLNTLERMLIFGFEAPLRDDLSVIDKLVAEGLALRLDRQDDDKLKMGGIFRSTYNGVIKEWLENSLAQLAWPTVSGEKYRLENIQFGPDVEAMVEQFKQKRASLEASEMSSEGAVSARQCQQFVKDVARKVEQRDADELAREYEEKYPNDLAQAIEELEQINPYAANCLKVRGEQVVLPSTSQPPTNPLESDLDRRLRKLQQSIKEDYQKAERAFLDYLRSYPSESVLAFNLITKQYPSKAWRDKMLLGLLANGVSLSEGDIAILAPALEPSLIKLLFEQGYLEGIEQMQPGKLAKYLIESCNASVFENLLAYTHSSLDHKKAANLLFFALNSTCKTSQQKQFIEALLKHDVKIEEMHKPGIAAYKFRSPKYYHELLASYPSLKVGDDIQAAVASDQCAKKFIMD